VRALCLAAGLAVRVPLINSSITDCVFEVKRETTVEEVNALLKVWHAVLPCWCLGLRAAHGSGSLVLGLRRAPLAIGTYNTAALCLQGVAALVAATCPGALNGKEEKAAGPAGAAAH
jgi:hypothetical protein